MSNEHVHPTIRDILHTAAGIGETPMPTGERAYTESELRSAVAKARAEERKKWARFCDKRAREASQPGSRLEAEHIAAAIRALTPEGR